MAAVRKSHSSAGIAVLLLLLATVLLTFSVRGWLTDSDLSGAIWPGDVNGWVIGLLGGYTGQDALGKPEFILPWTSVLWRGLLVVIGLLAFGWIRQRKGSGTANQPFPVVLVNRWTVSMFGGCLWWLLYLIGDIGLPPVRAFTVGVLPLWISVTAAGCLWACLHLVFSTRSGTAERLPSQIPSTNSRKSEPPDADGGSVGESATEAHLPTPTERRAAEREKWWAPSVLVLAMLGWIAISYWMNACLFEQLLIPHGDSAMYEEHLWNVWHGKGFRSYLDQGLFLGEHIQVIHLLLLPLHMLWPSHLLLELAESIALGSCAIPIYRIAFRHTESRKAALLLGLAWLFYFPMHFLDIAIDQKTLRPIAMGLPFVFWLIDCCERRAFGKSLVFLLLALSAKEDMALMLCPLLFVLAVRTWRNESSDAADSAVVDGGHSKAIRWQFGLAIFTGIYLVLAVLVVIPAFRAGAVVHYSRYFGDLGNSPGELVRTAVTAPIRVLEQLLSVRTLVYVLVFLAPVAFVPLRRAGLLLAGALTFGMLALIQLGDSATDLPPIPYHHFHAPLLPVVFWVLAIGVGTFRRNADLITGSGKLQRWLGEVSPVSIAILVLSCSVCTAITGSLMPCGVTFWSRQSPFGRTALYQPVDVRQQQRAATVPRVLEQIPATARVASTDYIHTRLTHCERSYDYSDYLRAVNDFQPGVPADTNYIVIDTGHRYSTIHSASDIPELQEANTPWKLLPDVTNGQFLILRRESVRR